MGYGDDGDRSRSDALLRKSTTSPSEARRSPNGEPLVTLHQAVRLRHVGSRCPPRSSGAHAVTSQPADRVCHADVQLHAEEPARSPSGASGCSVVAYFALTLRVRRSQGSLDPLLATIRSMPCGHYAHPAVVLKSYCSGALIAHEYSPRPFSAIVALDLGRPPDSGVWCFPNPAWPCGRGSESLKRAHRLCSLVEEAIPMKRASPRP